MATHQPQVARRDADDETLRDKMDRQRPVILAVLVVLATLLLVILGVAGVS